MPLCSTFPNPLSIARVLDFAGGSKTALRYKIGMSRASDYDWYLRDWMVSLSVTQADLCRLTGFPKAKMSELVNGVSRYNRDVVNTISRSLHVAPYELLMHPDEANGIKRLRE